MTLTLATAQPSSTSLGAVIRRARLLKRWSQRDLMKRSRLDYTYISKLENNAASYPPSDKVLGQLAEALDLEQADLTILAGRFPRSIQAAVIRLYQQHGDRLLPMLLELEQEVRL